MHMRALCLTLFLFYVAVLGENNKKTSKKALNILAYLQGYKPGQTLKIPAFLISPIIIVPHVNKQHSDNPQPASYDENFEEYSAIIDKIIPVRIMLNGTIANEVNNDIEVNFRQALNRGRLDKSDVSKNNTNKTNHNDDMVENSTIGPTAQENKTITPNTTIKAEHNFQNVTELTSTESGRLYPTAVYNNQIVDTLTITDGPPNSFLLPPLLEEEWKNFTVTTNINITKENNTEVTESSGNINISPSVNETGSTTKGPYPAALYNNAEIDQVSITTNSYTNESPLPPPQDDRWRSFSSLGEMISTSSEFRPLAGLYYDGYLHRPLSKNPGFVPYNQYFLY